jgi:hypothetical protein
MNCLNAETDCSFMAETVVDLGREAAALSALPAVDNLAFLGSGEYLGEGEPPVINGISPPPFASIVEANVQNESLP